MKVNGRNNDVILFYNDCCVPDSDDHVEVKETAKPVAPHDEAVDEESVKGKSCMCLYLIDK